MAETSFIQVLVSGETSKDPDVAYDLRLFEVPESKKIDLEPIIQRLQGMILLQREKRNALKVPKFDNKEEEKAFSSSSTFARI